MNNSIKQLSYEQAKKWVNNPFFDTQSKNEIKKLLEENNSKELINRFYKNLEFGTGGIRSIIGAGINRINRYTIMKATQALAQEVKNNFSGPKVAISYDSRKFSFEFAKVTASVLAANGIKALIYKRLNPVCLLSFSVRYHKAQAGVMITASHNPSEYNGYKVYWDDGAQVITPYDKNIINNYNDISDFSSIPFIDFKEGLKTKMIEWVGEDVEQAYLTIISKSFINPEMCIKHGNKLKFIYTPIHGTGLYPCTAAFNNMKLTNYSVVKEQEKPDGNFPTVTSPNPENPEALKLGVDLMIKEGADICFGSDPDADRIGLALPHKNKIHYLSGNQIGSLLLNYICQNYSEQNRMPENPYCVKTIVTTELQTKIANNYGLKIENTLTGFKWIGGLMRELEDSAPNRNFIFGTEESFGYLNHTQVRDKDGVAPIALLAEMTLWYKLKGMTLIDGLNELYNKYGLHHEELLCLNYDGIEGVQKIIRIMEYFRNLNTNTICDEKIIEVTDLQSSTITNLENGKVSKSTLPSSNVIGLTFKSGTKLFLRPSGTEPKIKFYMLISCSPKDQSKTPEWAQKKSNEFFTFITSKAKTL